MEEMRIQAATDAVRMAPVRSSTNTKMEEERLSRKSTEPNAKEKKKKSSEEPSAKAMESAVHKMNDYVEKFSTKIGFSLNEKNGGVTIIVTDKDTGKVIRQIPAKEVLDLNRKMEEIAGIIFDEVG